MYQYLCWPATITADLTVVPRGECLEVDAANEADAAVIAKQHLPLREGEQMAVIQKRRVINVFAWQGLPTGQGGASEKVEGGPSPVGNTN